MKIVLGIFVLGLLAWLLFKRYQRSIAEQSAAPKRLFAPLISLLDEPELSTPVTMGTQLLTGKYQGHAIQIKTIVDTLNTRKLPSLWLMVTIAEPINVSATFNLMMRPSGPSTFSNFDDLPHTIPRPANFPELAVLRTDDLDQSPPIEAIRGALKPFYGAFGKELLISPKGVRMVIQAAEADRARYGVFRQADFGDVTLDPIQVKDMFDILITLQSTLNQVKS